MKCRKHHRKHFAFVSKRRANPVGRFDKQGWPVLIQDSNGNVSRFYNTHKPNGITLVLEVKNHTESTNSMYRDGILTEQHFDDASIYYHRDSSGTACVQVVPSEIKYGRKRGCHV